MKAVLADIKNGTFAAALHRRPGRRRAGVQGAPREGRAAPDRADRPRAAQADGLGEVATTPTTPRAPPPADAVGVPATTPATASEVPRAPQPTGTPSRGVLRSHRCRTARCQTRRRTSCRTLHDGQRLLDVGSGPAPSPPTGSAGARRRRPRARRPGGSAHEPARRAARRRSPTASSTTSTPIDARRTSADPVPASCRDRCGRAYADPVGAPVEARDPSTGVAGGPAASWTRLTTRPTRGNGGEPDGPGGGCEPGRRRWPRAYVDRPLAPTWCYATPGGRGTACGAVCRRAARRLRARRRGRGRTTRGGAAGATRSRRRPGGRSGGRRRRWISRDHARACGCVAWSGATWRRGPSDGAPRPADCTARSPSRRTA